jgi:hypothetical protein
MIPEREPSMTASLGRRLFLEEFLIDFLGGLVPGVLFFTGAATALALPLYALRATLGGLAHDQFTPQAVSVVLARLLEAASGTPGAIWITLFLGGSLLAYVVGHLFYRHDVKEVDRKSFERLQSDLKRDLLQRHPPVPAERIPERISAELGCSTAEACEFPYPDFDRYLAARQLEHLGWLARWTAPNSRSKTYINILKVRLRHYFPDKCSTIIRNEAHVRLVASTWYVARILRAVSVAAASIAVGAVASAIAALDTVDGRRVGPLVGAYLPALLSPVVVLALAWYAVASIPQFFHYQRLREVFFVLETAHTAFAGQYQLLSPPFEFGVMADEPVADTKQPATSSPPGRAQGRLERALVVVAAGCMLATLAYGAFILLCYDAVQPSQRAGGIRNAMGLAAAGLAVIAIREVRTGSSRAAVACGTLAAGLIAGAWLFVGA